MVATFMHLLYRPSLAHVSRLDAPRLDRAKTTVGDALPSSAVCFIGAEERMAQFWRFGDLG